MNLVWHHLNLSLHRCHDCCTYISLPFRFFFRLRYCRYIFLSFCFGRFQLPFSPPVHTPVSVHQTPGLEEKDMLTSEPAVSRLRLAWNLGWHENIENLSKVKGMEDVSQSNKDIGWDTTASCYFRAFRITSLPRKNGIFIAEYSYFWIFLCWWRHCLERQGSTSREKHHFIVHPFSSTDVSCW